MTPINKLPVILSFTLMLCFLSLFTNAQTPDVLEVSYQEVTTKIRSQSIDDSGNTYYAGVFKGALVKNIDTLAFGKGGDDYFLIKEGSDGATKWVLPFGSAQSDNQAIEVLYHKGFVYLSFATPNTIEIAGETIPLLQPEGLTNCLMQLDTSGHIKWYQRSNQPLGQMYGINGSIMVRSSISNNGTPMLYEADTVFMPNGFNNQLFLKISEKGNVLDNFFIFNEYNATSQVGVVAKMDAKRNRNYFWIIRINSGIQNGSNTINFNGNSLSLSSNEARTILVKADSLWNVFATNTLDANGIPIFSGNHDESRIRFSTDSTELHLNVNSGIYLNDGFNENLSGKNSIVTIDTNLVTKSIKHINTNALVDGQARVRVNYFQETQSHYFMLGNIIGRNQSPSLVSIPQDFRQIQLLKNYSIDYDFNGASKSFLLKTNKDLEFEDIIWLTDQSIYENAQTAFDKITVSSNHIQFLNGLDNIWNPWKISTNLTIVNGSNRHSADQSDYIERVKYFSNKTKLLLGLSNGLNAFDETDNGIVKAGNRRDFFYAVVDSNNQTIKYNRLFSSFGTSIIRGVQTFEDSTFVLLRLTSPRNQAGFNFIKIGNYTQIIPGSIHSIIIALDTLGNFSIRDLHNTPIGPVWSFDIFPNGDFALMTGTTSINLNLNGQIFPNRNGFYIARSTKNGIIMQAMKIFPTTGLTSLSSNEIFIEKGTDNIITSIFGDIPPNGPDIGIVSARNGNQETSITISNPSPNSPTRKYYFIAYKASFNQNIFANALGPFSAGGVLASLTNNNHNSYISFRTGTSNDILKYNNQVLLPAESNFQSGTFSIDKDGNFLKKITFSKVPGLLAHSFLPVASKTINNHIYVIGAQAETLQFGALKISHKGEGDGLIFKLDTSLNLIQFYNVASVYSDICTDIDFFADSSLMIAYRSQGTPTASVGLSQISLLNAASGILPSDLEESGYVSQLSGSLAAADFIFTIKDGSWHDASIWNTGMVPKSTDRVFVRHKVQLLQNTECYQVFVDPLSDLKLGDGINLTVTGKMAN